MRLRRPRGTQTTAAPSGTPTLPESQRPSGPAASGRPPYLRAWTASAMGPPKSAPARMPSCPSADGSMAPSQIAQKGDGGSGSSPQAGQRGGKTRSSSAPPKAASAPAISLHQESEPLHLLGLGEPQDLEGGGGHVGEDAILAELRAAQIGIRQDEGHRPERVGGVGLAGHRVHH